MKYNGIIESKLRIIEQKLAEIESWKIVSFSQLRESSMLQNAVERALQVCTEVMIDISERILALNEIPPLPMAPKFGLFDLGIAGFLLKETWPVSYTHLTLPTKRIV